MSIMKDIISKSSKLNMLFVEDNKDVRETSLAVFENFFNKIDTAINGEDALEKFLNNSYDLIITDINMPKVDGTELIHEIRKVDIDVKIFVFSAHNEAKYFTNVENIKIDYYLPKPLSLDHLVDALTKLV